jgi:hypothetical protein
LVLTRKIDTHIELLLRNERILAGYDPVCGRRA